MPERAPATRRSASARAEISDKLKYWGFAAAAWSVPRLPLWLNTSLAVAAAEVALAATPARRRAVSDNLRHVLGAGATPRLLGRYSRRTYWNVARYYVDLLRLPVLDPRRLERERLLDYGYAYLTEALAEGHGVILATIHFGRPELTLQAARARGLRAFVLVEPLQPAALFELYLRLRLSHGHRYAPVGFAAIKDAVRTLRRGGIVVLMVDRDIQGNGVYVPFLGAMARLPTGAVDLARLTGAPIIPAVSRRLAGDVVEVTIEPRVRLLHTGDRAADQRANLHRLISRFERHLRQDPDQWLVLEPIWRRRAAPP